MNSAYRRNEPLDALVVDGEALLLLAPDQVVRLSPIATAVFQLTGTEASLESLLQRVQEQFGTPPDADATDALQAILDDLVQAGVLARCDDADWDRTAGGYRCGAIPAGPRRKHEPRCRETVASAVMVTTAAISEEARAFATELANKGPATFQMGRSV